MRKWLFMAVIGLICACTSQPPVSVPPATVMPPGFPGAYYRATAAQGARVFSIDPAESLLVIEVYRGGSLARLGHDHVVASHDVQGFIAPGIGRADLYVPIDRLVVDESRLRAQAGFDTQPSVEDIAGTRRNMLKALDADQFPFAVINVDGAQNASGTAEGRVTLTLRGVGRSFQVPIRTEITSGAVSAVGRLTLKQTDFGITPLSVLGGAIQVQDEVSLRFSIRARAMN
ncbi:MAG: YceI family protein [Betaproteobacteria bacterium]